MWPAPATGFEEVPCSVPHTAGLGYSYLPRQPQAQPGQSITHPEHVPALPPGGTRDPQVLPGQGLQDQQRMPLSSP